MTSLRVLVAAALVLLTVLTTQARVPQGAAPPSQPPPAPGERGQPPPAGRGPGTGGGRGNPVATLYTERCAGCHGVDLNGGRAPSLFDEVWARGADDESVVRNIMHGIPNTEMVPFKDQLTEPQIWQLVAYLRTHAATLKEKPAYVPDPDGQVVKSEKQTFRMEVVARGLETPWGLAFLPDGRLLITERPGRLRIVQKGQLLAEPVSGTPTVWERQDAGLLDVEVHPAYARTGWIYLAYVEPGANNTAPPSAAAAAAAGLLPGRGGTGAPATVNTSNTVIIRGKINAKNQWVDQQVILRTRPELYVADNSHFGSRFIFDQQSHLFYTIGDRGEMMSAQDLANPHGKIHRVNDDGSVPKDNPFANKPDALPTIWSYGHRNPQGLAWDPATGKLWESEHGPQGGDEINIVEPGRNYGWGVITMGVQAGITSRAQEGMEQPVAYYTPSIAPSGITFYTGARYPGWKNSLFVSALAGQQLRRLETAGDKVTHQEVVFNQFGRVHDVVVGPEGYLYVTLQLPGRGVSDSTPGMVARLVPVQQ